MAVAPASIAQERSFRMCRTQLPLRFIPAFRAAAAVYSTCMKKAAFVVAVVVGSVSIAIAQRGQGGGQGGGNPARAFLKYEAGTIAITHVRVIDGTGAPARADQTVILSGATIAAMGPAASTPVPQGATTIDGTGKSLMPGIVMLHEHLYYPTGPGVYGQLGASFVRLYLA